MYIRKTKTGTAASAQPYYTYRLVRSQRVGGKVRQKTLLNLGKQFDVGKEQWPQLCARIEDILAGQTSLLPLDPDIEEYAQRYAAQLIVTTDEKQPGNGHKHHDYEEVDVDSVRLLRPRSVGVEQVALTAIRALGIPAILSRVGFNGRQQAAALASIIGRMAEPGSERSTWHWLQQRSGLGELIDCDYESMSLMQLYRVSDRLVRNQSTIEQRLFAHIQNVFSLSATVTLYDLTNTFFEGHVPDNKKARHGHSKEKRSDCPLVTLGLVVDGSGFVRSSKVFEGNIGEGTTLETMLRELAAPRTAVVIMDRGVATAANIDWLRAHNFRYLVVSRERTRVFEHERAVAIESATGATIKVYRRLTPDSTEARLYCYSEQRARKDEAITDRLCNRFEEGLEKIAASLTKPRGTKRRDKVIERIGRLKQKSRGIGEHYQIDIDHDENKDTVAALRWRRQVKPGSQVSHPGVYCLRTNVLEWDEKRLWHTYTMLTDVEAVFRSLKSELGLRPIYHQTEERSDGHLFISVLAYQVVQFIRQKLKQHGYHESWATLRDICKVQQRVTVSFRRKDGRSLHVRKATEAEPHLKKIYDLLGLDDSPGGVKKLVY
jgi:transposase